MKFVSVPKRIHNNQYIFAIYNIKMFTFIFPTIGHLETLKLLLSNCEKL